MAVGMGVPEEEVSEVLGGYNEGEEEADSERDTKVLRLSDLGKRNKRTGTFRQ